MRPQSTDDAKRSVARSSNSARGVEPPENAVTKRPWAPIAARAAATNAAAPASMSARWSATTSTVRRIVTSPPAARRRDPSPPPRWAGGDAVPEAEAAEERVGVVAEPAAGREPPELRRIPATNDDVVRIERRPQALRHVEHALAPARLAMTLEPPDADVVLEAVALLVRQVGEFHRLEDAVDDERGPEAGAEAEKQHPAAAVAPERLHRGVVEHLHRMAEGSPEVEAHPAAAEVPRLGDRMPVDDRSGIADGDVVVGPVGRQTLHDGDHAPGRHRRSGVGLAVLALPRRQDLHVRPADVDDQYLHDTPPRPSGECQPPTSAVSALASSGPHVPAAYARTAVGSSRIGCTTCHAASTPSSRAKSIASPAIASTRRRS